MKRLFGYPQNSRWALVQACVLIACIAFIDWKNVVNVYFGFLYAFPMLLIGTALTGWQIAFIALFCSVLAELFDPFPWEPAHSFPQDILLFVALFGVGLFSRQVAVNRRLEVNARRKVENEAVARREAEEQLEFLIQTSPVAILVMSADGEILNANSAAHYLFRLGVGELVGRSISHYVGALSRVPSTEDSSQTFRTEMQCRGKRDNGDVFLANVFFSTYRTAMGPRLAAIVVDISEDLRDRAEYGFEQLMTGSRILMGAVSHEVRNVCSAIAVIYENLARTKAFASDKDFEALGSLVEALKKIASLELRKSTDRFEAKIVDLAEILDEARIVLEPFCSESDITMNWNVPENLPSVWADRHSFLQVLLNLTKNSQRALESRDIRNVEISVAVEHGIVSITHCDNGAGIASTEKLFEPLQKGSDASGLGLFLSRAFMRSLGGDLRYVPRDEGCCFLIELAIAETASDANQGGECKDAMH